MSLFHRFNVLQISIAKKTKRHRNGFAIGVQAWPGRTTIGIAGWKLLRTYVKLYHQILCRSNCIPERPFFSVHGFEGDPVSPSSHCYRSATLSHAQLHVGSVCQPFGSLTLQVKNCTFHPWPSEDRPTPKRIRGVNKNSLSFEPSGFLSQNGTFIIGTSIATNANICQRIHICMRAWHQWHPKHI